MINNAAQTYLLLQSTHNTYPHHGSYLPNVLVGIPLILILLFLSIGFVLDIIFNWEAAFDYIMKMVSILMLIAVIGLIISICV